MAKSARPGIYSATYSNVCAYAHLQIATNKSKISVYELKFGDGLKEHVMRRRDDNWINATHILKAAGLDKPTRTRILEREVQKQRHEKIQGGYGKYQGTWVPLDQGKSLAQRNQVYEKLQTIFEYIPGVESPPAAPKTTTSRLKALKRSSTSKSHKRPTPTRYPENTDDSRESPHDNQSLTDETPFDSSMDLDESYEVFPHGVSQSKPKRPITTAHEQAHIMYSDELLDYFMLSSNKVGRIKPEPPLNFNPDWIIDNEGHTALHWAAAMGDVEVVRELKRYGANLGFQNSRGETPLMRCILFINCQDKNTMPGIVNELIETVNLVDFCNSTALHHAAALTVSRQKNSCARYYLDVILNKMEEFLEPHFAAQIINAQDIEGNTALHIVAKHRDRKCVRALIGQNASIKIRNNEGITAEDEIRYLNETRRIERQARDSSSPYGIGHETRLDREIPWEPQKLSHLLIQSRVAPQLMEMTQDLANSFDGELKEKDITEQEVRQTLNATIIESQKLEQKVNDLRKIKENPETSADCKNQLRSTEKRFLSIMEHQNMDQLRSSYNREHEDFKANCGSLLKPEKEDDLVERIELSETLGEQQRKRQALVQSYLDVRSMAGGSEKSILYRKILLKSLGPHVSLIDENLDVLVEQLKEKHENTTLNPID